MLSFEMRPQRTQIKSRTQNREDPMAVTLEASDYDNAYTCYGYRLI